MSGVLISVDRLITEVKKMPCIWHIHHADYSDKGLKMAAWKRICHVFYPDTVVNTTAESMKVAFMQKKWKSVRDYYTKQRKEMQEDAATASKRRRYIYFDMLQFLEANFQSQFQSESDPLEVATTTTTEGIIEDDSWDPSDYSRASVKCEEIEFDDYGSYTSEQEVDQPVASTSTRKRSEMDEDELFLLSLLPSIRKLAPLQKMDFKLEVMNALKRIQFSTSQ